MTEICAYCLRNIAITKYNSVPVCIECYNDIVNKGDKVPKWLKRTMNQVRADLVDLVNHRVIEVKYRLDLRAFGQIVVYALLLKKQFGVEFEKIICADDIYLNRREIWYWLAEQLGVKIDLIPGLYLENRKIDYNKIYQKYGYHLRKEFNLSLF
ncbi:MAG: hypothetical protein QXM07_09475 [Nitrososphaerota archaeon]